MYMLYELNLLGLSGWTLFSPSSSSAARLQNLIRLAVTVAPRRGTLPSIDNGGTALALLPTDGSRGAPPSVNYGGTAPGLNPIGGNQRSPPSVDYGGTTPALYPADGNCGISPSTPQVNDQRKSPLLARGNTLYEIRAIHGFRREYFPPLPTTTEMSSSGHWFEGSTVECRGYHQSAKAREPCRQSQSVDAVCNRVRIRTRRR